MRTKSLARHSVRLGDQQTGICQGTGWHAQSDSDGRGFAVQSNETSHALRASERATQFYQSVPPNLQVGLKLPLA